MWKSERQKSEKGGSGMNGLFKSALKWKRTNKQTTKLKDLFSALYSFLIFWCSLDVIISFENNPNRHTHT
jgi:hypothetical protein